MTKLATSSPFLEQCRHTLQANGSIRGTDVAEAILPHYPDLISAIPRSDIPALASIDGRRSISHDQIRDFIAEFGRTLAGWGIGPGHRVALVLPNGPELALAILSVAQWASCVPLNASGARSELKSDLQRCSADLVVGVYSSTNLTAAEAFANFVARDSLGEPKFAVAEPTPDGEAVKFAHVPEIAASLGIPFAGMMPSPIDAGIFRLFPNELLLSTAPKRLKFWEEKGKDTTSNPISHNDESESFIGMSYKQEEKKEENMPLLNVSDCVKASVTIPPNSHDNEVLVLFTSGTTGVKKIVPHRLGDVLVAAATIALSWNLSSKDTNCNLMPLFHVGGILRQIFAPVVSGGAVVCCPGFDPSIFWALLERKAVTWYYAAPTMHQMILQAGEAELFISSGQSRLFGLRMIANAAGGLLPSLAVQLRETFGAHVLPSYGMTECMPISSPPSNYQLDRAGTSGVPVGPEVAIRLSGQRLGPNKEGLICVRGTPCFHGYAKAAGEAAPPPALSSNNGNNDDDTNCNGWFETGDLGYLDNDGFLFITGRSKEVINRGGEIISPMEVEEAILSHPIVVACAAISIPHDVLQETVGIVVVPKVNEIKLDLPTLHKYLSDKDLLSNPKWPQVLIYMNDLPKSHTNKLLRVKMAQRMGFESHDKNPGGIEINDEMPSIARTFEAICPPKGTPLTTPIKCDPISIDPQKVQNTLWEALLSKYTKNSHSDADQRALHIKENPNRPGSLVGYCYNIDLVELLCIAEKVLDGYVRPNHYMTLNAVDDEIFLPPTSKDAVMSILYQAEDKDDNNKGNLLTQKILGNFSELLNLDYEPPPNVSFFNLGGGSMLASQLASQIRRDYGVPFSGAEVFQTNTADDISATIAGRQAKMRTNTGSLIPMDGKDVGGYGTFQNNDKEKQSIQILQSSWFTNILFLIPIMVLLPVHFTTQFLCFFHFLFFSPLNDTILRAFYLIRFLINCTIFGVLWTYGTPLVFVAIKWFVIGKYKAGVYPIYGSYYMRWWFVNICGYIIGEGAWGANKTTRVWFYRMLGAKIGKNCHISSGAVVGEYDLLTFGDNCAVEYSIVRAFTVETHHRFRLGEVTIGRGSSVGTKSVVAPGSFVPDNTHLGPLSTPLDEAAMDPYKYAPYNRQTFPELGWYAGLFWEWPSKFVIHFLANLPGLYIVYLMIIEKEQANVDHPTTFDNQMRWLCNPSRIPFYVGAQLARALVTPFLFVGLSILYKWCIIGKFQEGPINYADEWQLFRHKMSHDLFSGPAMENTVLLIGRHYEFVSVLLRCLGAKIGKRVFWPGTFPKFSGEWDLLEIGDDVVFGSKCVISMSTVNEAKITRLCAGCNVSDNSVILAGATIGKNAVMGSKCLCPEDRYFPQDSLFVGSSGCEPLMLEKGTDHDATIKFMTSNMLDETQKCMIGDETTLRPFGKAFYYRDASYFVWPLPIMIFLAWFWTIFSVVFHTIPLLLGLHLAGTYLYGVNIALPLVPYSSFYFYMSFFACYLPIHAARLLFWALSENVAKWACMGMRQEGEFNYDEVGYAQRWELFQYVGFLHNFHGVNGLHFLCGTPFLTTWYNCMGASMADNVTLFPSMTDRFLTEPDLITMQSNSVIDCASVVCHLNTRGAFTLKRITFEENSAIRVWSRAQQGVVLQTGCLLKENALAMTGEVVEAGSVWEGAPAVNNIFKNIS